MPNLNSNKIKKLLNKLLFVHDSKVKRDENVEFDLIEAELKIKLDKNLRSVLRFIEGGYFNKSVQFTSLEEIPIFPDSEKCDITKFYSLNSSNSKSFYKMKINNEDLDGKTWLPFAEATPGDHLCISFESNDYEAVYFVSHEEDNGFYKVSNSINDFFKSLHEGLEEDIRSSGPVKVCCRALENVPPMGTSKCTTFIKNI